MDELIRVKSLNRKGAEEVDSCKVVMSTLVDFHYVVSLLKTELSFRKALGVI